MAQFMRVVMGLKIVMTVSELIKSLNKAFEMEGDKNVRIQTTNGESRTEQDIFDVWIGHEGIVLVSKEAMDKDPLLNGGMDISVTGH